MKARITMATTNDGQLEIFLNAAGRDLLVKELLGLSTEWDHFHFAPEEFEMEVAVQTIPYRNSDRVFEWGKVLFRPDDWDAQHYPHVLPPKLRE